MGMFKWAKEDSNGSPLFAGALAGSAVGAKPLADYVSDNYLIPSISNIDQAVIDATGTLNIDQVKALKENLLDKSIRDKLLVLPSNEGAALNFVGKRYLPERAELEKYLRKGGLQTYEGLADPVKAVQAMREAGGFIDLPGREANAIALAHELGHATSLNPGRSLRSSRPYRLLDMMGRKLVNSGSRGALASALLAGSISSDDNSKWLVPGGIALTQIPLLAEEATASSKAINALKSLKDLPSKTMGVVGESNKLFAPAILENAGKSLRRAWGTYGLGAAGLLAAPVLAIKAREQWDNRA